MILFLLLETPRALIQVTHFKCSFFGLFVALPLNLIRFFSVARNIGQNSETIFWPRSYAHRMANHFVHVLFLHPFGGAKSQRKW